jgi:hypothetical protein
MIYDPVYKLAQSGVLRAVPVDIRLLWPAYASQA